MIVRILRKSAVVSASHQVDEIRERMARIRHDMHENVHGLVDDAKTLADWKHYVKANPWLAAGAAAALGYLAVPARLQVSSPDPETLAKLAKNNRLVVKPKPEAVAQSGVTGSIVTMMSNLMMRAAVAWAGQQVGKFVGERAADTGADSEGAS